MALSKKAWIGVGVGLAVFAAVLSVVLVLAVFNSAITDVTINNNTVKSNGQTTYRPGERVFFKFIGKHVGSVNWEVTYDKGQTYNNVATGVDGATFAWTVPTTAFSDVVRVRVTDAKKDKVTFTTPPFRVTPNLVVVTGARKGYTHIVPSMIKIEYKTGSSLLTTDNVRLKISTDNDTYEDPSDDDRYTAVVNDQYVQWSVNSSLRGKVYLKIVTDGLVAAGYPSELSSTTFEAVTLTGDVTHGHTGVSGGVFSRMVLSLDRVGNVPVTVLTETHLIRGETIYLRFELQPDVDPLTVDDLTISYGTTLGSATNFTYVDGTPMHAVSAQNNLYSWTVPDSINGERMRIRLTVNASDTVPAPSITSDPFYVSDKLYIKERASESGSPALNSSIEDGKRKYALHLYSREVNLNSSTQHVADPRNWSVDVTMCDGNSYAISKQTHVPSLKVVNQTGDNWPGEVRTSLANGLVEVVVYINPEGPNKPPPQASSMVVYYTGGATRLESETAVHQCTATRTSA